MFLWSSLESTPLEPPGSLKCCSESWKTCPLVSSPSPSPPRFHPFLLPPLVSLSLLCWMTLGDQWLALPGVGSQQNPRAKFAGPLGQSAASVRPLQRDVASACTTTIFVTITLSIIIIVILNKYYTCLRSQSIWANSCPNVMDVPVVNL